MVPKGGTPFSAGEPPVEVGYLLTCHHSFREEGLPKITRNVLQRNRPLNNYKASGLSCPTCQLNNPQGAQRPQLAQHIQHCGTYPGEDWQIDFTQMPISQRYKYLPVMVDMFTGWIESFPTQTEKAEEVATKNKNKKTNQQTNKKQQKTVPLNHSMIWSVQVITK